MTTTDPAVPALDDLRAALTGTLHLPGDSAYAALATPWNLAVSAAPVAVVEAADASDVQAAVRFAAATGLQVDVRRTGHGATHDGTGTLLVHTGRLAEVELHPDGWARAGAGVRWADMIPGASGLGYTTLCGSAPDVGIAGYLTGGGLGPLARSYGVSSDSVRAVEIVTGDGELHRATATADADLFWGVRGGKGALGIVTAIEFELLPLASFFGGAAYFAEEDIPNVLRSWAVWLDGLDERATSSAAILRLPPMPGVPEPLAGRTVLAVRFAWTGDAADGASVVAPLVALATPVLGGFDVMPAAAIGMIHADPVDPMPAHEASALLTGLPSDAVESLLAVAGPGTASPQVVVELRHLGGAIGRTVAVPDAFDHRDAAFALHVIGIGAGPLAAPTAVNAAAVLAAMEPWSDGGALPNFAPADDPAHAAHVYRPATLARLASIAAAHDPARVIRAAEPVRRAAELAG